MRSPERICGIGAARHLACALLISVHAAAAHEHPAAIVRNALVVTTEQLASIDIPSSASFAAAPNATKSVAGSYSAFLQSAYAWIDWATTNLAPVVTSSLVLASAVPACGSAARPSALYPRVVGYLLVSKGFARAAPPQDVTRFNKKGPRAAGRHVSVAKQSADGALSHGGVPELGFLALEEDGRRRLSTNGISVVYAVSGLTLSQSTGVSTAI